MEHYKNLIDQLRSKQVESITIPKEQFEEFRQLLITLPDFKHFRGEAQQGGNVIFTYLNEPRS